MRKLLFPGLVVSVFAFFTLTAAEAQTSIACEYMLLRVYKAELDTCKVPLTKDREARYWRIREGMEKFIRANAKNDPEKIISGIETDNIKRALAGLKSCKSDDFKYALEAMDKLTTLDHEKMVQGTLGLTRDPMQGSCGG